MDHLLSMEKEAPERVYTKKKVSRVVEVKEILFSFEGLKAKRLPSPEGK